jgi:LemA protein|tara:strand:- start:1271 stop:1804 length:534 start_codon:yes stop_codon:yes gene_type:complete
MRWFLAGIVIVLIMVAIFYNGFISRRNAMRNAFASIDVQLKKRWNLIPNLVETVKGFATHEREVLKAVVAARSAEPGSRERFVREGEVSAGVGRLLAVAEDYPELKSSDQFLNLQRNLTEVESQISASRRAYNAAVTEWNDGVEAFPGVIFARVFDFNRADWFEVKSAERLNVEVNL